MNGNIIRKSAYMRLMLPAVLTAILVIESLMGYTAPDYQAPPVKVTAPAYAAEVPELETIEQAEKTTPEPQGTAGKLAAAKDPGDYEDGTYTGSARGFGGTITVKVTIKGGKITSISISSASGETGSFLGRAKAVIGRMIKKQSTNVDAVSGATYSSNGIIKAVRNALAKAAKKGSKKSGSSDKDPSDKSGKGKKDKNKEKTEKPEGVAAGNWIDGTYIGEGEGFSGKLHVEVVIRDGKIYSVELLDTEDDSQFMDKAKKGVISSVLDTQGTDVDSVTGATYSSYGLIEAINDALSKASADAETGDDSGQEGEEPEPEPDTETENVTMTSWVYYDEDEDFDDYQITVTFSSEDGRITAITEYSQTGPSSNNWYIRTAVNGINTQLSAGSDASSVDAVTGATCTSTAIIGMLTGEGAAAPAAAAKKAAASKSAAANDEKETEAPDNSSDANDKDSQVPDEAEEIKEDEMVIENMAEKKDNNASDDQSSEPEEEEEKISEDMKEAVLPDEPEETDETS